MMTVVVGGAGFIGSHLVELLLNQGYVVRVIDNLSTGCTDNVDMFRTNSRYTFYDLDIVSMSTNNNFVFKGVDVVFHLAGLADIIPSIEEPLSYYDANVTGTMRVLEACRNHGVKKLIFAASSSCYGIPETTPTAEDSEISPRYPYSMTKFLGEYLCLMYNQIYGLPVTSLRLFNVYGLRGKSNKAYGAVFKTFLSQKLNNLPLTIIGDGTQLRDFVAVKDVARAFLLAGNNPDNEILNIGGGNPESINRLAELIAGKDYPKEYLPWRTGEPKITHADISKAKNVLGWEPTTSFEAGVKEMVDNIEYWKDQPNWTKNKVIEATKKWQEVMK
jgi:UDP-glucose 4-epimerase